MLSGFFASVDVTAFQTMDTYSSLASVSQLLTLFFARGFCLP
jgi:hypothetical protein